MSYNIDSVRVVAGGLRIEPETFAALRDAIEDMPECNPWEDPDHFTDPEKPYIWWHGEGSGHTSDGLRMILAATTGRALVRIVWEGGDRVVHMRVTDGLVEAVNMAAHYAAALGGDS